VKIRKRLDEPRDKWISIRLSKTERDKLAGLANGYGVSVGAYLVGLALGNDFVGSSADAAGEKPDPAQVRLGGF
jgi:hypothetical protein